MIKKCSTVPSLSKTATSMNRTLGSMTQLAPKTPRRQFLQWAVKWFYSNATEDTSNKPDIPSIICLLQTMGFQLRKFDKREESSTPDDDRPKNKTIRVTVECGSSQMEAMLEMDEVICECANNSEVTDGSLWSITGTGPMDNINKVEKTGSSLLPAMSDEVTSLVRDVVYTLVKIINNKEGDVNQNTDSDWNIPATVANDTITKSKGLVRSNTDICNQSYKSLSAAVSNSSLVNSKFNSTRSIPKDTSPEGPKRKLKKQGTYDLEDNDNTDEPRPSPPKLASSPVLNQPAPSTSLGHISLQSEEELLGLADYVVKAHQILDNAVNFIIKRLPLSSSSHSSIQEDGAFVRPTAPPLMSSSFSVASTRSAGGPRTSNGSVNSLINRSVSSVGSTNSAPGQPQIPKLQKPQTRRSGSALPNMRERSSSFNVNHRTQQQPSPRNLSQVAAAARRRTTTAVPSNASITITPRSTVLPKLPTSSKFALCKSGNSLAVDRTNTITNKRRLSPSAGKTPTNSPATQQSNQRSNVSLLKIPSKTSGRHSISTSTVGSSKFGFTATKK